MVALVHALIHAQVKQYPQHNRVMFNQRINVYITLKAKE